MIRVDQEGGSGKAKTGALCFNGDWPGLFIRGDQVDQILRMIDCIEHEFGENPWPELERIIKEEVLVEEKPT